jgi:hypothetical protein
MPESFVQLAQDGTGKKIRNLAVQTYVDLGDGNGPQLTTVNLQVTAAALIDPTTGAMLALDDLVDADWKRKMLLNTVATRIGIQELLSNAPDRNIDLMVEAQNVIEDSTVPVGSTEDS